MLGPKKEQVWFEYPKKLENDLYSLLDILDISSFLHLSVKEEQFLDNLLILKKKEVSLGRTCHHQLFNN